jgi:YVTN family beta-propeller protein
MRVLRPLLLLLASLAAGERSAHADAAALTEVSVIPLPGVRARIDHLDVDPAGKRLFVAALGNGTLEVLDLAAGKRITSISGLKEPQGVAYLPSSQRIVVATHGGAVHAFDEHDYRPIAQLPGVDDADNLRFDAGAKQLYLGYGDGALGVIDPSTTTLLAKIPLPGHPESFRLEEGSPRIFVNVPPTKEILVVDRTKRAITMHLPLGAFADNYPMSLDEAGHRLFVGVRKPARLLVFDTASGKQLAAVPCVGDTDDLFYDARRSRVYVIGGEGYVDVFDAGASGKVDRLARIPTRAGARTGLWSAGLDRLFVAWPLRDGHIAEIHVLAPSSI